MAAVLIINYYNMIIVYLPDRAWLRNCFIGRKLRIERTKESLDGYFCCRAMIDEFFGVRDPLGDDVQTAMRKTSVYIIDIVKLFIRICNVVEHCNFVLQIQ